MDIWYPAPPRRSLVALGEAFRLVDERPDQRINDRHWVHTTLHPHLVYEVFLADAANGRALHRPHLVGWRYIVSLQHEMAAVEIQYNSNRTKHLIGEINFGHYVKGTLRAVEQAKGMSLPEGDYMVSVLRMSSLCVMALWLQWGDRFSGVSKDILVPITPFPSYLEGQNGFFHVSEFESVIQPEAARLLRLHDLLD